MRYTSCRYYGIRLPASVSSSDRTGPVKNFEKLAMS